MTREQIIENAEKELLKGLDQEAKELLKKVLADLKQFSTKQGRFSFDELSPTQLNELENKIRQELLKTGYKERVQGYLNSFNKITEANIRTQAKAGIDAEGLLTNIQKSSKQFTINALTGAGMDANFINPVKTILYNHIVSGSTIAEAELGLREFVLGTPETVGRLERYVGQVARDGISQYDGLIQAKLQKEFGLDGISYEGSLIVDSRPQCVRWIEEFGGILRVDELESEIDWAFTNGSGMIPGTTKDTFTIYRGGFNCRHFATAIRLE